MSLAEPENPSPSILTRDDGATIAYHRRTGRAPGVIFLGGFMSDMSGTKATSLDAWCAARGQSFLRFDYFGHGQSSGAFAEATVGRWKDDALAAFDNLTEGPQVLVGSSLGGWIMLLVALERPERVKALLGVASAPDATEDLMWKEFPEEIRLLIEREGSARIPSSYSDQGYLITWKLIEEGRRHLLMRGPITVGCPVRLVHGLLDADVSWRRSLDLAARLAGADVQVTLVKDGDHRLSRDQDLALITRTLATLLD
jgi:pimeloyl-ACP methyl ester carboxylesterase